MWPRIPLDRSQVKRRTEGTSRKPGRRSSQQPHLELLEDRQLLTATLQSIPNLSVPAQQGFTQPLLAAAHRRNARPANVHGHVQQSRYRRVDHSRSVLDARHQRTPTPSTPRIASPATLTFRVVQHLTPNTVKMIDQFTNDGYYVNTGKYFSCAS